jgi:peptide/nickel transport system ATP-binding protein
MDSSDRLLTVRGLRVRTPKERGGAEVLRGVDLDIAKGEIVGLVGESGSGKTTTALAVMHLLPPGLQVSAGEVVFEGRDVLALKPRELQDLRGNQIAMIFQDALRHLNPVFTVGDQIEAVIHAHHPELKRAAITARAKELLEQVQIADPVRCLKSYPHQFSGGMAQRAMIAMALAGHPDLLLADEPTSALDVTVQAEILRLLRRIARERNMAVLFISHNLSAVWQLCDRVCVMYAGQVVEESSTVTLVGQPEHPYTRALLRALPRLSVERDVLASIPGNAPSASSVPAGCAFHPRCAHARADCLSGIPALVPFAEGHQVRCRYAGQLSA